MIFPGCKNAKRLRIADCFAVNSAQRLHQSTSTIWISGHNEPRKIALDVLGSALICPTCAAAAGLTGGSIKLEYGPSTDETDLLPVGIEWSLELAFSRNVSTQTDLGYNDFGFTGLDSNAFGLHCNYNLNDDTSSGVFSSREVSDIGDADIYGLKVGHEMAGIEFEAYVGRAEADGIDANVFGIQGGYPFDGIPGLAGSFDRVDEGIVDLDRFAIKVDRDLVPNVSLFAELGSASAEILTISNSAASRSASPGSDACGCHRAGLVDGDPGGDSSALPSRTHYCADDSACVRLFRFGGSHYCRRNHRCSQKAASLCVLYGCPACLSVFGAIGQKIKYDKPVSAPNKNLGDFE